MSDNNVSAGVDQELSKLRRAAIRDGWTYIVLEVVLILLSADKPRPVHYACTKLFSCDRARFVLSWFPPFYIILSLAGLITVMALFAFFIFSYENQADLTAYSIKSIRPVKLTAFFILSSLTTIIFLFAELHQWTGIYGDTVFICKNGECISSSVKIDNIWECLYFSAITITTVGYGDYHPLNSAISHCISAGEAISGYIILGILVSSLSNTLRGK